MERIFLEAAAFSELGGWIVDTQCFEALGSAYLMAHGIGHPVQDASTPITTARKCRWHIHVRTRDWSAVWKRGTPAGRFQLLIDGAPQDVVLGTNGEKWAWQNAGSIELEAGEHTVSLHNLTGFNGRCDAVYFTTDADDVPPDERGELNRFRRECCHTRVEEDPVLYDFLICGGGYAGICMALTAGEKQLRFKLIQDRPVLGGCGSSEVRVWTGGIVNLPPYPELGNVASKIAPLKGTPGCKKEPELFEDARKALYFTPGENLLLNEIVIGVETAADDPRKITAIITRAVRTGRETRRRAKLFADCTGDATLARMAGCETMYGSEGHAIFHESLALETTSPLVMGHSTLWETYRRDHPVAFPDVDWGIEFTEKTALARLNCCWDWETGQFRNQVAEIEYIRDYGLMTCFANWSFLKNHSERKAEWANLDLAWISAIGGKRESYRVCGDLILTQNDIENKIDYPDGTGPITWSIDLHFPDPENQRVFGEPFQSCAYHRGIDAVYQLPYRCLYARDVKNLFLGGRDLSLSHVAFSCVRVMRTLGTLGEVCGLAAELCIRHDCHPADIYTSHLAELKQAMKQGVPFAPPFGSLPAHEEAYHFMRPVGTVGNDGSEDCWYPFRPDGAPEKPIPPEMGRCIEALALLHRNGEFYRSTDQRGADPQKRSELIDEQGD